jgi:ribosomal protein L37AE/L43A
MNNNLRPRRLTHSERSKLTDDAKWLRDHLWVMAEGECRTCGKPEIHAFIVCEDCTENDLCKTHLENLFNCKECTQETGHYIYNHQTNIKQAEDDDEATQPLDI